jgi:hypothetical protein
VSNELDDILYFIKKAQESVDRQTALIKSDASWDVINREIAKGERVFKQIQLLQDALVIYRLGGTLFRITLPDSLIHQIRKFDNSRNGGII